MNEDYVPESERLVKSQERDVSDLVSTTWPREGVAVISLDNPEINNQLSFAGVTELGSAIEAARDAGARVLVLASAVDGHWWEHAWLTDLLAASRGAAPSGSGVGFGVCLQELAKGDAISIAAISGDTSGGGAELGWACDLRIVEEQVLFGQPEIQIGLTTGIGGTSRLARLIGRTATAEMVLLGTPMTARRLYELGAVNRVVPKGSALEVALDWADTLAARPPEALAGLKRILAEGDELPLSEAMANEQRHFQAVFPSAIGQMIAIQDRFNAGASMREVYGEARP